MCHPKLFCILSPDSSDGEVIRPVQVFAELKQMTIPSLALRSDVVTAIADEVVRSTCRCQSLPVMPACRSRSIRCFTTDMPTWTSRRKETRQPLETCHLLIFCVVFVCLFLFETRSVVFRFHERLRYTLYSPSVLADMIKSFFCSMDC